MAKILLKRGAMLDSQSTDIRALVTDPRGPDGLLPLDPLTCERLPEGVLARALTQLRAVADAPVADQRELERRVALERARADDIARACEVRVTAALATQLSAEQRYDQQDAKHERSTPNCESSWRRRRTRFVCRPGAHRRNSRRSPLQWRRRDTVQDVATRLGKVERRLAASPATAAGVPVVATSKAKPPKSKKPRAAAQARTPMRTTRAAAPPARGRRARDSAKQSRRRA